MKFLRLTARYLPNDTPCCMRSREDCDPVKAAECEAGYQNGKTLSWDYVIPGTLTSNEYVFNAKLATGGMVGQPWSGLGQLIVEEGLEAPYEYDHDEWRDNPASWLPGPLRDEFVRVVDGVEEVFIRGNWSRK